MAMSKQQVAVPASIYIKHGAFVCFPALESLKFAISCFCDNPSINASSTESGRHLVSVFSVPHTCGTGVRFCVLYTMVESFIIPPVHGSVKLSMLLAMYTGLKLLLRSKEDASSFLFRSDSRIYHRHFYHRCFCSIIDHHTEKVGALVLLPWPYASSVVS